MTTNGCAFLEGTERLMLPLLRSAAAARTKKISVQKEDKTKKPSLHQAARTKKSSAHPEFKGVENESLFEELRALRKQVASARGVPPFVIFADTSLREMARTLPQDEESFLAITGVGAQKLKWFGPMFMKKIKESRSQG